MREVAVHVRAHRSVVLIPLVSHAADVSDLTIEKIDLLGDPFVYCTADIGEMLVLVLHERPKLVSQGGRHLTEVLPLVFHSLLLCGVLVCELHVQVRTDCGEVLVVFRDRVANLVDPRFDLAKAESLG